MKNRYNQMEMAKNGLFIFCFAKWVQLFPHYRIFFKSLVSGTAEPLFGVLAEQGFGGTFQHYSEKCPVV